MRMGRTGASRLFHSFAKHQRSGAAAVAAGFAASPPNPTPAQPVPAIQRRGEDGASGKGGRVQISPAQPVLIVGSDRMQRSCTSHPKDARASESAA